MRARIACYVALGDSFTAGTGAERWPDRVARALGPEVRYANLAAVGATSRDVEERQLGAALSLRPELVSLICGANDVLESVRPDLEAFAARLSRMFARIRAEAPAAAVITATYPDLSRLIDLRQRSRRRVRRGLSRFNAACREAAAHHGVLCLEGSGHPAADEPASFAGDGFHPSSEGHRRAAADVLRALEGWLEAETRPKETA